MKYITMSRKELEQVKIFEKLKNGKITQAEAAYRLNISDRWVRKKLKRYKEYGEEGLIHKSRGKQSEKRWSEDEKTVAIELLKSDWYGFGPTFAAEKLAELHRIVVSKETLRQAMIEANVWNGKQRRLKHRKRRERRAMLGLMIQLDGSPHDWFEGRGQHCTLLVFIDDATSQILWLEFVKSEDYQGVMNATKNYIQRYGRPHEFYVDFGKVFSVNLNNEERIRKTQWERALEELSIRIQHAHSPQAKGRVERANKTLQDRLIKEMRLAEVSSIESANRFIQESNFIAQHNKKFVVSAAQKGDAHRSHNHYNLDDIFALRYTRVLMNDYTVLFQKRIFQLERKQRTLIRPKDIITVTVRLNQIIILSIRRTQLCFKEVNIRPQKQLIEKQFVERAPYKPNKNSRRWAAGELFIPQSAESRVKPATPAVEAK